MTLSGVPMGTTMNDVQLRYFSDIAGAFLKKRTTGTPVAVFDVDMSQQMINTTESLRSRRLITDSGALQLKGKVRGGQSPFLTSNSFRDAIETELRQGESVFLEMLKLGGLLPNEINESGGADYFNSVSAIGGTLIVDDVAQSKVTFTETPSSGSEAFVAIGLVVGGLAVVFSIVFLQRHCKRMGENKEDKRNMKKLRKERELADRFIQTAVLRQKQGLGDAIGNEIASDGNPSGSSGNTKPGDGHSSGQLAVTEDDSSGHKKGESRPKGIVQLEESKSTGKTECTKVPPVRSMSTNDVGRPKESLPNPYNDLSLSQSDEKFENRASHPGVNKYFKDQVAPPCAGVKDNTIGSYLDKDESRTRSRRSSAKSVQPTTTNSSASNAALKVCGKEIAPSPRQKSLQKTAPVPLQPVGHAIGSYPGLDGSDTLAKRSPQSQKHVRRARSFDEGTNLSRDGRPIKFAIGNYPGLEVGATANRAPSAQSSLRHSNSFDKVTVLLSEDDKPKTGIVNFLSQFGNSTSNSISRPRSNSVHMPPRNSPPATRVSSSNANLQQTEASNRAFRNATASDGNSTRVRTQMKNVDDAANSKTAPITRSNPMRSNSLGGDVKRGSPARTMSEATDARKGRAVSFDKTTNSNASKASARGKEAGRGTDATAGGSKPFSPRRPADLQRTSER
jgi:hypothetical protein